MGAYQSHHTIMDIILNAESLVVTPSEKEVECAVRDISQLYKNGPKRPKLSDDSKIDRALEMLTNLVLLLRLASDIFVQNIQSDVAIIPLVEMIATVASDIDPSLYCKSNDFAKIAQRHTWMLGDVYMVLMRTHWAFEGANALRLETAKVVQQLYQIDHEYWFLHSLALWNESPTAEECTATNSDAQYIRHWMLWCMSSSVTHRLRTSYNFAHHALIQLSSGDGSLIETEMFRQLMLIYKHDIGYFDERGNPVSISTRLLDAEYLEHHYLAHIMFPDIFMDDSSRPSGRVPLERYVRVALRANVTVAQMNRLCAPIDRSLAHNNTASNDMIIYNAAEYGRIDIMQSYGFGTKAYNQTLHINETDQNPHLSIVGLINVAKISIRPYILDTLDLSPKDVAKLNAAFEAEADDM